MSTIQFQAHGLDEADSKRWERHLQSTARLFRNPVGLLIPAYLVAYSVGIRPALEIANTSGVSIPVAKQAMNLARQTNARHEFVLKEAVNKAGVLKEAFEGDRSGAASIIGIRFTAVGGTTGALVSREMPGVTVQYTVSGTDGYYDSNRRKTNNTGRVSFNIPTARPGVVDTISVTAVLSGVTAQTKYVW